MRRREFIKGLMAVPALLTGKIIAGDNRKQVKRIIAEGGVVNHLPLPHPLLQHTEELCIPKSMADNLQINVTTIDRKGLAKAIQKNEEQIEYLIKEACKQKRSVNSVPSVAENKSV